MFPRNDSATSERGQFLVIVAAGMIVLVALVGLVIDGGYAWGRQRDTQNAADAAALAGATVMAERLAGAEPARTDANVDSAVNTAFLNNEVVRHAAFYTDITGQMITAGGAVTTNEAAAAAVGNGSIPSAAAGVLARGVQTFDTFLMRIVGFNTSTVTAPATAVAGSSSPAPIASRRPKASPTSRRSHAPSSPRYRIASSGAATGRICRSSTSARCSFST